MLNKITGELTDQFREGAYLDSAWPRHKLFGRSLFGAGSVILCAVVALNLSDDLISSQIITVLVPVRVLQILACVFVFLISFSAERPRGYHYGIFATLFATIFAEFANDILVTLPSADGDTPPMPFLTVIIFIYYTLVPTRLSFTILLGAITTVLYTFAASLFFPNVLYLLLELIFVNLIGISYGRFINQLQRQDYLFRIELEHESAERQHAETQAIEARRIAEQASIEKSKFIAVASHDLRQPLHAMGLWIDTLYEQVQDQSDQRLVETVTHLTRAKDSLDGLLDRLLHASHLDSGTTVVKPGPLLLSEVLRDTENRFRELAARKNIEIRLRSGSHTIISDDILLTRILDNLMDNAIKYAFSDSRVLLGCRRSGNLVRLQVWNRGEQIPIEQTQHIFDEFHQSARGDGHSFRGLGLGLSIVKRLCELLGHPIRVKSSNSGWTMFEIQVPLAEGAKIPTDNAPRLSPFEDLDLRVLVIDDDSEILEAMEQLLTRWNIEVMCAVNQKQALSACESKQPDLIISDQHLGNNENGISVVSFLLKTFDADWPIILMSGETSAESLKIANDTGYPLFTKPVKPANLRLAILQAMGAER
tara:strand:- start:14046 stop:15824 length:1779 start_codon:yes stop_codon:yes gene_type:complete